MNKVYLTQKEFDDLLEYTISIPTGVIIGKQWKRHMIYFTFKGHRLEGPAGFIDVPDGSEGVETKWLRGTYYEISDPDRVGIRWEEIVVAGKMEIDKTIARFEERSDERRKEDVDF